MGSAQPRLNGSPLKRSASGEESIEVSTLMPNGNRDTPEYSEPQLRITFKSVIFLVNVRKNL
jgi:hypothetical protein